MVYTGSEDQLHQFIQTLQTLDNSLKFTYTVSNEKVDFLDLTVSIANNRVTFNTFQKTLNKYLYLPAHSQHPWSCKKGFIIGELIRYARNCTHPNDFLRTKKLFYQRLLNRGYSDTILNELFTQIQHNHRLGVNTFPRIVHPKKLFLVLPYHPRLTGFTPIIKRYWNSLPDNIPNTHIPSVSYKVPSNLRVLLSANHLPAKLWSRFPKKNGKETKQTALQITPQRLVSFPFEKNKSKSSLVRFYID